MKRQLCATAFFALALIPDWAAACWPPGSGPAPVYYAPMYPAPVYSGPIYYPAQPVYVRPIPSSAVAPRFEPARPSAAPTIGPARPIAQPNPTPAKPPQIEPVRPAAAVEAPKPPAPAPEPKPAPESNEPKRGGLFEIPKPAPEPEPKAPAVDVPKVMAPKVAAPEPKAPVIEPPKPDALKLPPINVPTGPETGPKLPPLETSPAVPSAAPAPDALPIPSIPTPKKPDALPPLTLPPDAPVAPDKSKEPVEVKSSPLTGAARELKVSVFPATGTAAANGLRKVGFFNHTARDLSLTIEGKAVTLPALSYLNAELPSSFTWKCGEKPATKETVPAGSVGVDVLIRE
jgi:hypothetical protein